MTADGVDQELKAIEAVVSALGQLDADARARVVEYVLRRYGLAGEENRQADTSPRGSDQEERSNQVVRKGPGQAPHGDIRTLKDQKAPRNSIEMAAVVAYYLSEMAPSSERRDSIGTGEIRTYFKQAGFPLPAEPRQTLFQGRNAGYLDGAAHGKYKLNPVGYNLVAHNLPATDGKRTALGARALRRTSSKGKSSKTRVNRGKGKRRRSRK